MTCPKCKSDNVTVQAVAVTQKQKKGCLYWAIIGWWWRPILWIFLTLPMLILSLFGKKKTQTKVHSKAVCQACGHMWTA